MMNKQGIVSHENHSNHKQVGVHSGVYTPMIVANWKNYGQSKDVNNLLTWISTCLPEPRKTDVPESLRKINAVFCLNDKLWQDMACHSRLSHISAPLTIQSTFDKHTIINLHWGLQDFSLQAQKIVTMTNLPRYVIIGHQDCRTHDSYDSIARKVSQAIDSGLIPILCLAGVEDSQMIITASTMQKYLISQALNRTLPLIVALEPASSIGTDTLLPWYDLKKQLKDISDNIHNCSIADPILLYGGSVKAANVQHIFRHLPVQGLMVGRASLPIHDFMTNLISACAGYTST